MSENNSFGFSFFLVKERSVISFIRLMKKETGDENGQNGLGETGSFPPFGNYRLRAASADAQ